MFKSKKYPDFKEETSGSSQEAATAKKVGAIKNFLESKINGAINEIFRRKELDESVEKNLSQGLEVDRNFFLADRKINRRRNWFSSRMSSLLDGKSKKIKNAPSVLNEGAMLAMKELEEELDDPFTKKVYSKLADFNKQLLLDHLVDNPISRKESQIIELPTASEANNNVIAFSDNGYLLQLSNKEEVRRERSIDTENEKALYNLISPDGKVTAQGLSYSLALENLMTESSSYQKLLKAEFKNRDGLMAGRIIDNTEAEINELAEKERKIKETPLPVKKKLNFFIVLKKIWKLFG